MTRKKQDSAPTESVLMNSTVTAELIGCSVYTILRWHASGLIPVPINIRNHHYWKREEILRWIEAKCPTRKDWKKINIKY